MVPFNGWGSTASRLQSHYDEAVCFLPLSSQKFLVLIWSTSEIWKAESTLELPSGFEHKELTQSIKKISKVRHFKEEINMASCSVGFIKKMNLLDVF